MKQNVKQKQDFTPDMVQRAQMNIVIVGHVDHGKSTLVGRLLADTGSLPAGKLERIRESCLKRGMPFEWSFLMDALQAERNQGITIEVSHIWFKTALRDYVIIDAPGHKEFLKNMISGAAASEAALLIIDAQEGVKEQSMRHGYLLHLLGVRQIAVLVNKMDAVGYSEEAFRAIETQYCAYLDSIGVAPTFVIPVSARAGEQITRPSVQMPWYNGPSVLGALDSFSPSLALDALPLRLPVQDVYKFDERRIIVGRIESGTLAVGDELLFSPGNRKVKVASIEAWNSNRAHTTAVAGESVGITLAEQIFIERGHMASQVENAPLLTNRFRARLFWLGAKPLAAGKRYRLRIGTGEYSAEVSNIERAVDTANLTISAPETIGRGGVAEVVFRLRGMASVDAFEANPRTGRFVVLEDYDIVGGGIIDLQGFADQRVGTMEVKSLNLTAVDFHITPQQRAFMNGHLGGVLWFTGLSGSGKSTLALELQRRLFAAGYHTYVLDGDNIRSGLNKDLGFSAQDRAENIRRVGEVAALFAQAGVIVITAFISPYNEDRARARVTASEFFHLIHIKADLRTCEARDAKGLYKKARAGEIADFTGISAPYEEPQASDLVVDTSKLSIEESVSLLVQYVKRQLVEPVASLRGIVEGGI